MQDDRSQPHNILFGAGKVWLLDELLSEVQATLAALTDLECSYEQDQERLRQALTTAAAGQHEPYRSLRLGFGLVDQAAGMFVLDIAVGQADPSSAALVQRTDPQKIGASPERRFRCSHLRTLPR